MSDLIYQTPVVFTKGGAVFANSRDVADFFVKDHRNVLRDIDNLICEGVLNFEPTPYIHPQNGQTYRSFDMDRDGFTLLAMGFTGSSALQWKLRYIEAFNRMEAELSRPTTPAIPQSFSEALRLAADQALQIEQQSLQITEMKPSVEALDLISSSEGSLTLRDAAKNLQWPPGLFNIRLAEKGWVYKPTPSQAYRAYQNRVAEGVLEQKITMVKRRTHQQTRVTPKGLARLAKELS